tara:strand:- start:59 stop:1159 length:1101 start_codon:yes stop_codon:yes gene_type:complete
MTDYSFMIGGPGAKGNVLTIPKGAAQAVATITPSNAAPSNTDHTAGSETLTVDTWEGTSFHLSDQEMTQIDADNTFIPLQIAEAFKGMGDAFDAAALALYKDIYGASGTPGTAPFATTLGAWTGSGGARAILQDQLSPMGPLNSVLDSAAEGNLLGLSVIHAADSRGSDATMNSGQIGSALGVNWHNNQNVPTHTPGTLSDGTGMLALVNDASYTVGESTVDIDATSLSGTVVVGDIFTVAGDSQQYTVTAGATAGSNAIAGMAFKPTSQVAWANNAQITFIGGATSNPTHVANMVFHPGAFGYAFARPEADMAVDADMQTVIRDPVTGIPIRLMITREHYQTTWRLDYIYGVKTIREELACRIAG